MNKKIGIVIGRGRLPILLIEECLKQKQNFILFPIKGQADPEILQSYPHLWIDFGKVGKNIRAFKNQKITSLLFAGYVARPRFELFSFDMKGFVWLSRLIFKFFKDDALLSSLIQLIEKEGIPVTGIGDVAPSLLMKAGTRGKIKPALSDLESISVGIDEAKAHGTKDKGQGVLVLGKNILGRESIWGTNRLLRSTAKKYDVKNAILVKTSKPQQDLRIDLPTVGKETIVKLKEFGYKGVSLEAGKGIFLDEKEAITLADKHGIFIYGH